MVSFRAGWSRPPKRRKVRSRHAGADMAQLRTSKVIYPDAGCKASRYPPRSFENGRHCGGASPAEAFRKGQVAQSIRRSGRLLMLPARERPLPKSERKGDARFRRVRHSAGIDKFVKNFGPGLRFGGEPVRESDRKGTFRGPKRHPPRDGTALRRILLRPLSGRSGSNL